MPFVSIRISGTASKAQKAGIVADVTDSLVTRLGKNPAAVQIVIEEVSTENYGAGGLLIVDRDADKREDANADVPDDTRAVTTRAARDGEDGPTRSCILTRDRDARATLIRLALAPDGAILPDVRAKAPGRGAWIGVTRAELETAIAKGKLKGALARAFKTGDFAIPADLPDRIAAALEKNALDRLGLEAKSGTLLTGSDKIADAARSGQLKALYHAADASPDGARKLAQAWRVGSDTQGSDLKGLALPVARPILSLALGRENVVHIGVIDRLAAARLGEALDRWLHFIGPDLTPQPCETASQGASAPGLPEAGMTEQDMAVKTHEEFGVSETDNEKPKLGMRAPLGLKRTVETGKVKQSFSHGRSNTVVVEVKRRRVLGPQGGAPEVAPTPEPVAAPVAPAPAPTAQPQRGAEPQLSAQERQAKFLRDAEEQRMHAQEDARRRTDAERHKAVDDDKRRAEDKRVEAEAPAAPEPVAPEPVAVVEPEAPAPVVPRQGGFRPVAKPEPVVADAPADRAPAEPVTVAPVAAAAEPAPVAAAPVEAPPAPPILELAADPSMPAPRRFSPVARPEIPKPQPKPVEPAPVASSAPAQTGSGPARPLPSGVATPRNTAPAARPQQRDRKGDDRRTSGKLTVNRALGDDGARSRSLAALKRAREKEKRHFGGPREAQAKQVRDVQVPEAITVQELANRMAEKGADLVKTLFKMGSPVTMNQVIDQDTAELLVTEFGHNIVRVSDSDIDLAADTVEDAEETLQTRPPVVTIMGHVDHGKTSLLDALRGTDVARGEAGGITQHIGAYQVTLKDKSKITFLDTPGHEAFTQMRARGADITDIVILTVAADDGLMPQTIEAIAHTKAAGVPMIVAINKVDKEGANPQRVRERLLEHEVMVEEMGGETQDVEVSALKKTGLDLLIEKIQLQAELLELRANPDRPAEGTVIEAKLDKGRGPVATVLVNRGTLRIGDIFVIGAESGKVRALMDDKGKQIKEAGPAMPVEVLGLSGVPSAGDPLQVVENEARAREVAEYRRSVITDKRTTSAPASLESMFSALKDKQAIEYPLVVKADTQGTVEAIVGAINKISTDLIKARVLHSGVGGITESDVTLAGASGAPIIGFNVRPNAKAREIAERQKVAFKYYDVIYDLIDEIRAGMAGELGPEAFETVVGRAEIREVFSAGKHGKAAGLLVTEGVIRKALKARITRADVIIYQGEIASLRRFKDDVAEVRAGLECGVTFTSNFVDIKPGDFLETFEVEMRERTL